jgi:hypothetical protein
VIVIVLGTIKKVVILCFTKEMKHNCGLCC